MTRNEITEEMIYESGLVDGVFHHMAAVNPCVGTSPEYRYPRIASLEDKTLNMSWVFLFKNGVKAFGFGWLDNPVTHLGSVLPKLDFTLQNFLDDLGKQNKTMEEARDAVLSHWEHSEVYTGTIAEFESLFK